MSGGHGGGGHAAPASGGGGTVGALKMLISFVFVAGIGALCVGISSGLEADKAKRKEGEAKERAALVAKMRRVRNPKGQIVATAAFLEVRPGKPRHHTFSKQDEVVAVRYLGEGPEYRDDDGEKDAGVWVDWSGTGAGWRLDEPGPQDDQTPPWEVSGFVLFGGRKKGQTLTFNVVR